MESVLFMFASAAHGSISAQVGCAVHAASAAHGTVPNITAQVGCAAHSASAHDTVTQITEHCPFLSQ